MRIRVNSMDISDGSRLAPPDAGMVLFVGPNNAGKSQSLKDIAGIARDARNYQAKTIIRAEFEKSLVGDFAEWAASDLVSAERSGIAHFNVQGWGEVPLQNIISQWHQPSLNVLTGLFVLHLDGNSRLTAGDSQGSIDLTTSAPSHPVQLAYSKPDLERALDEASREAFDLGLAVDRYAGSVISLRLGEPPAFSHESGRRRTSICAN